MNIDMITAAAARLDGHAVRTPLLNAPLLDHVAERRVWIKAECLQRTGSFKFRGAWSAVSALAPEARAAGVIGFSSGNHAQGLAQAAQLHGSPCVIVMPSDAPRLKVENTRAYGAEVVLYERGGESREEIGAALAETRGLTLIRPYDDPQVIAGQGSVGLEIAAQTAAAGIESADVIVCCGGGGLTSGIALALDAHSPGLRVRPAEPKGFDDVARSLRSGTPERNAATAGNICDAILTPSPGTLTFPILQRLCGPGIAVSEDDALFAMQQAFLRLKLVAEPGGAVALAAALRHQSALEGDDVVVVLSGGNVDPTLFQRALDLTP